VTKSKLLSDLPHCDSDADKFDNRNFAAFTVASQNSSSRNESKSHPTLQINVLRYLVKLIKVHFCQIFDPDAVRH